MHTLLAILKPFVVRFTKIFVVLFILSCADGFYFTERELSMFTPEVEGNSQYRSFYRTFHHFYDYEVYDTKDLFNEANVDDWYRFFEGKVPKDELIAVLYHTSADQILQWVPDSKSIPHRGLKSADLKKRKAFLEYLNLAIVNYGALYSLDDRWYVEDDAIAKQKVERKQLFKAFENMASNTKYDFVRQRCYYQMMRFYFEENQYENAIEIYENRMASLKKESAILDWRGQSYVAGCLRWMGRIPEANIAFAKIYDQFNPLLESSLFSFVIEEDNQWDATLALAKTPREKEVLWQLFGIKYDEERAIKAIYEINPKSELLSVLLTRWVNKKEEDLVMGYVAPELDWDDGQDIPVNVEFLDFIEGIANSEKTNKPALWHLAAGYLSALTDQINKATLHLDRANQLADTPLMKDQIRVFKTITRLQFEHERTNEFEVWIVEELRWMRQRPDDMLRLPAVIQWIHHKIADNCDRWGAKELKECLWSGQEYYYTNADQTNDMIAFMTNPNRTPLEAYSLEHYSLGLSSLYELQGIYHFYQGELEKALEFFQKIPFDNSSPGDPFAIHINDCHDCDHLDQTANHFTKAQFVEILITLRNKTAMNPNAASEEFFLLANAWYNCSYYGNARWMYHNDVLWDNFVYEEGLEDAYPANTLSIERAAQYYAMARANSHDPEFRAKCTFMMAKCEQNEYFTTGIHDYECILESGCDFIAGRHFRELRDQYSNTQFYMQTIKECGYFRTFLAK